MRIYAISQLGVGQGGRQGRKECGYERRLSLWSSSNFLRARRMFIRTAAVSACANPSISETRHERKEGRTRRTDCGVVHDDKHVRVLRQLVEHRREVRELELHRAELLPDARARVLERLDELRRALVARGREPVRVGVLVLVVSVRAVVRGAREGGLVRRRGCRRGARCRHE